MHAVVLLWARRSFAPVRARPRTASLVALGLTILPALARFVAMRARSEPTSVVYALSMLEMLIVGIAGLPIGLLLAARRTAERRRRRVRSKGSAVAAVVPRLPPAAAPPAMGRRDAIERGLGLTALGSAAAAFGWGMVVGRHDYRLEEVTVRIAGLPRALEGYTIAQVSDMHAGLFVDVPELARGLSRIRDAKPDLVVVTGDLVDFDARYAPELGRALFDAAAGVRDGAIAVLGNHDYYAGAREVASAIRAAGVEVLVNAGKRVRAADGGGFALLGVDDLWAKRRGGTGPHLEQAIRMVPPDAPRILLAHNPLFLDAAAGHVALQLSGHMHGGQINPGVHLASLFTRYVAGRYEREGTTLWVNRGFGVAGPPVRLEAPPEITKVVLVAA